MFVCKCCNKERTEEQFGYQDLQDRKICISCYESWLSDTKYEQYLELKRELEQYGIS